MKEEKEQTVIDKTLLYEDIVRETGCGQSTKISKRGGDRMAYTSVKISANSSDYQSQMKSAAAQMKVLSAEYTTAATKAKLFGSETDSLKQKPKSLTQKINGAERHCAVK